MARRKREKNENVEFIINTGISAILSTLAFSVFLLCFLNGLDNPDIKVMDVVVVATPIEFALFIMAFGIYGLVENFRK